MFMLPVLAALTGHAAFAQPATAETAPYPPIESLVDENIRSGNMPGAVVLIGQHGKVVYRRAFGQRAVLPAPQPMNEQVIFDIASLTKVVATAPAVMQLVEQGKLRLEDPVARYWPEFTSHGKDRIKVRDLLTHYSGLPEDLGQRTPWSGTDGALQLILEQKPFAPPGTAFLYSDLNFMVLGELVRRASGLALDEYCARNIFAPLGMKDTGFRPADSLRPRIAPTDFAHKRLRWGEVQDPVASRMGGVAGHAGLFATADDLARYAQALLNGGTLDGARILSPLSVEKMTTPQSPLNKSALRGLGWDIDSPYAANRGELFPVGAYGHTGYTGTSLSIDPISQTYVILLTSRLHPDSKGDIVPLRAKLANIVAASLGPLDAEQVLANRRSLSGYFELNGGRLGSQRNGVVSTGIDVLAGDRFTPLRGKRVGLITNHSGIDANGRSTVDVLRNAKGVKLVALFNPEHGLSGKLDARVAHGTDERTRLPIYSLYGDTRRPTAQMLKDIDALVFDIQDAGVRFYTYITTLGYVLEEAARQGIAVYVLDRPNPISAAVVQGPVLAPDMQSFTGYFPLPVRHGMTVGELAQLFNSEKGINARLEVIRMRGYHRSDWFDETGLRWLNPSPNLRTLNQVALYPGVGLVEGANVSVGRGTDHPFEVLGAPWIDGKMLAAYLNRRRIQGVRFMPADFTPRDREFKGERCHGVQIVLTDRQALNAPALGIELASALHRLFRDRFQLDKTLPLLGSRSVLDAVSKGEDPQYIAREWQPELENFARVREKYLLY